jgi:hypothetical protein
MFNQLSKDLKSEGNSIDKILQHLSEDKSCAIISPFRDDIIYDENLKRLQQLKSEIRKLKLGFIEIKGY